MPVRRPLAARQRQRNTHISGRDKHEIRSESGRAPIPLVLYLYSVVSRCWWRAGELGPSQVGRFCASDAMLTLILPRKDTLLYELMSSQRAEAHHVGRCAPPREREALFRKIFYCLFRFRSLVFSSSLYIS